MKARVSQTTAEAMLSEFQKDAIKRHIEKEFNELKRVWVRRYLLATCLALNDLYHFGDKRLALTLNGIGDIVEDYAGQAYSMSEAKKVDVRDPNQDPINILMETELASRKCLHIEIGDFLK